MDVHVPWAITRSLRRRGVDVLVAQEDGAAQLPDPELLDRATALKRLVFSMDQDFLIETAQRQRNGKPFISVIFARPREIAIGQCVADLELISKALQPEESYQRLIFLPL